MGKSEESKPTKSDKSSSPAPLDHANNVHAYPDWAAMQAYYGPRVAIPAYYSSAVASGHPPPYMWGPHPMIPPYGTPYGALYPHGGVYAHPSVPMAATPLSIDTPTKSTGNTDNGLMKKLKEFDGLAMSIGNSHAEGEAEQKQSESSETEGSTTDGSDGNTTGTDQPKRKRSRDGTPTKGVDGKPMTQSNSVLSPSPGSTVGKPVHHAVLSAGMNTKSSPGASQHLAVMPPEVWLQDEKELKREKRKQSNRESARRSRLRKQAEAEELARKVESLAAENASLRSEINRLTEKSGKLRVENSELLGKLQNPQLGDTREIDSNNIKDKRAIHVDTENLLSRVNNSGPPEKNGNNSKGRLHQLLDSSPRADAVAAAVR